MFKRLLLVFIIGLMATSVLAKNKRRISNETIQNSTGMATSSTWRHGKDSIIKLKGQLEGEITNCQTFKVKLGESLSYQIDCAGHELSGSIQLKNTQGMTVTQKGPHTTITKYNFLTKKLQVSRLKQSTLKVPYVEEIIHIKKNSNGELSFYFESFKVDEFGRIVQDGFIQAHSLTNKKMKISAN